MPKNCPMKIKPEIMDTPLPEYFLPENKEFFIKASELEVHGYCEWPRIREVIEFCYMMGYKKVGMAFCVGLHEEARRAADILRKNGLEVVSVVCKVGHVEKSEVDIKARFHDIDTYEDMCNPILQAKLLNEQKTDFNIMFGLCVGHDSLFYKYSDAMVTSLVSKDRVTAHNPVAAICCGGGYQDHRIYPYAKKEK